MQLCNLAGGGQASCWAHAAGGLPSSVAKAFLCHPDEGVTAAAGAALGAVCSPSSLWIDTEWWWLLNVSFFFPCYTLGLSTNRSEVVIIQQLVVNEGRT